MNIFVLCTGRCGSMTFAKACAHATNFTAGHETRIYRSTDKLGYPDQHIEVDNRLSYILGALQEKYGDAPFYVHLTRAREAVALSYAKRLVKIGGIAKGWIEGVLCKKPRTVKEALPFCRYWIDMVNANIREFLRDKAHIAIDIDDPQAAFREFWVQAGLEGDLDKALATLKHKYNAGSSPPGRGRGLKRGLKP